MIELEKVFHAAQFIVHYHIAQADLLISILDIVLLQLFC